MSSRTSPTPTDITTLAGGHQTITGGPVASQEAIKELGTNGGGFFNANSAHPFENPNALTNLFEIFLILLIPVSLTRTFGRMVGTSPGLRDPRRMGVLFVAAVGLTVWAEISHARHGAAGRRGRDGGQGDPVRSAGLGALRASPRRSRRPARSTRSTLVHAPSVAALVLFNMLLGEVAPGASGSGLYGMLVLAILTVFVAGLMVGRTPEYLGKKISAREMKLVSLYILTMPRSCSSARASRWPCPVLGRRC